LYQSSKIAKAGPGYDVWPHHPLVQINSKAELLQEGIFFLLRLFKIDIIKVGLVCSISNFFIAKTSLANNWRSFSSSYSALVHCKYIACKKGNFSMSFIFRVFSMHF
jgi:hypothetical protein